MVSLSSNAESFSVHELSNLSFEEANHDEIINKSSSESQFDIEFLEKILNYEFKKKNLLLEAFTDATFEENCVSYERLEHLGDTILNSIITDVLFELYPESPPGTLTNLRAVNVDAEKLARVAVKHNLYRFLRHKKPMLLQQIKEFENEIKKYPLHSRGLLKVPKCLGDIVESTVGALYRDCKCLETVRKVIMPLLEPMITLDTLEIHPMTELHEMCQKKNLKLKFEDKWEYSKEILVFVNDRQVGRGFHPIKKDSARNCAAKDAILHFHTFF